ncbi:MAG: 16S rRNA (cytosine(1402)-N(4))-methyltransferase RsmH [Candidatus Buchananbacteria bacterium]|nr:16S rRNA (cytosine(1402)-N(4))-methyltransferase RsmH [Candidatus Buchananbacteria bacterium]
MRDFHEPVLSAEVIGYLQPKPGGRFIDCTLGGAGHTENLLQRVVPGGQVLGIDLDPIAIEAATKATAPYKKNVIFVKDNFKNINKIAHVWKFTKIDGVLLDLGLSSGQLQDQKRGFSFLAEGTLDMRFGAQSGITARDILNEFSQSELIDIFKNYGEERLAGPISKKIIEVRMTRPFTSPSQLVEIVSEIYHQFYRGKSKTNPATKIFQALRIAVNDEMNNLKTVLPAAVSILAKGGRLAVISYHSLEDRTVKDFFRTESRDCLCPPQTPVCVCGHKKSLRVITKKPVVPTNQEIIINPRARSAKLRVAEKI